MNMLLNGLDGGDVTIRLDGLSQSVGTRARDPCRIVRDCLLCAAWLRLDAPAELAASAGSCFRRYGSALIGDLAMFTSEDPETLAADLSRMTVEPVSVERAEQLLSENMAWLPQGEPLQCIAEDRTTQFRQPGGIHSLHRRTIVFRREGNRLQIMVEAALLGPDGIERERRRFDESSDEAARYIEEVQARFSGS